MKKVLLNPLWEANLRESKLSSWLGIVILLVIPVCIWWWLRPKEGEHIPIPRELDLERGTEPPSPKPDDLKRIAGIGAKVEKLLVSVDITSFANLAAQKPEQLRQILKEADLYMINPDSWPEQAKLASRGKWEALDTLQTELRGA